MHCLVCGYGHNGVLPLYHLPLVTMVTGYTFLVWSILQSSINTIYEFYVIMSQSQKGLGIQTSVKLVCGNIVDEGQPLWGTYHRFQLCNLCYTEFILQCQECMRLLVSLIFCRGCGLRDWTKLHKSHHYWMLVLPTCTPSSTSKTGSADMYPS